MKLRWAALASGWAVAALIILAPGADSASNPGLKLTTTLKATEAANGSVTAKCPNGYEVIGGGAGAPFGYVIDTVGKVSGRKYFVAAHPEGARKHARGVPRILSQAICAKGTGGFELDDDGSGLP